MTPSGTSLRSFEEIYEEHLDRVFAYIGYRVSAREDAEDLTQLTFERAFRAFDRFDRSRASHATWLLAIAKNLIIDHVRSSHSRTPRRPIDEVAEAALPSYVGPEVADDRVPGLSDALEGLGDREREVLALRFGAELSGREIAEVMELSEANVHQIVSRALRRLRERLEAERAGAADAQGRDGQQHGARGRQEARLGP